MFAKRAVLSASLVFLLFLGIGFGAQKVEAASLAVSLSSGSFQTGATFSVNFLVSSPDQAANAVSGVISFSSENLEVVSLSKVGSLISLWVQEPSFSNSSGSINFEGIILNPGFSGNGGKVLTANFRAKAAGAGKISFVSGMVLANDGQGTNILKALGSANISIQGTAVVSPAATPAAQSGTAGTPVAPNLTSPTHPEQDQWYSNSNPKFTWEVPKGVTAVKLSFDSNPYGKPLVTYNSPITEKVLEKIDDGVWYFHAQFKNAKGWGAVSTFRFQIDTKPPEPFSIQIIDGKEVSTPRPTILFNTTDSLSGIDHYNIKIGEGDFNTLTNDKVANNPYTLPPQPPGKRTILVKAVDQAGNYTVAVEDVNIKSLNAPLITYFPEKLSTGEVLIIKGTTYPESEVYLWIVENNGEPASHIIRSDENGGFAFVYPEKLKDGVYSFWVSVKDDKGTLSNPSLKNTFIASPPSILRIGTKVVNYLVVLVSTALLLILLALSLWYGWHKFKKLRKRLQKEALGAETTLHQTFLVLRNDLSEEITLLENAKASRKLTLEENKIIRRLKKNLDVLEGQMTKEIKQIEKEVK